jgi:hypothetical protein
MGRIRRGPPKKAIENIRQEFSITTFVETGTFYGSTAHWASEHFETVITIELDNNIYQEVINEYEDVENIRFVNGKSQEKLEEIIYDIPDLDIVFWLDAHYSGDATAGKDYECPLLEELQAIGSFKHHAFIFIDDARLFLSPPPRPHAPEDWPTIDQVMDVIGNELGNDYYIVVVEDVIIAVPPKAKQTIRNYARDVATSNAERSSIAEGIELIWKGTLGWLASDIVIAGLKKSSLYPIGKKIYHVFD